MIGSETKILAIADDGATKSLVESLNIGECFHWKDIVGIKNFIYKEFRNKNKTNKEWNNIKSMLIEEITKKLSSKII